MHPDTPPPVLDYRNLPRPAPQSQFRRADAWLIAAFACYAMANVVLVRRGLASAPPAPWEVFLLFALPLPLVFIVVAVLTHFLASPAMFNRWILLAVVLLLVAEAIANYYIAAEIAASVLTRRLLNLATLLSLVLCAAVVTFWLRSYRLGDYGEFVGSQDSRTVGNRVTTRDVGLYSSHGRIAVGVNRHDHAVEPVYRVYPEGRRLRWSTDPCWENCPFTPIEGSPASRSWTGVDVRNRSWGGPNWTMLSRGVAVPHAFVAAATAILPALWLRPRVHDYFRRRRVRRMLRSNLCPSCGYDLRAAPDQCPECGEQIQIAECGTMNAK